MTMPSPPPEASGSPLGCLVDQSARVSRTVSESDVYLFAGVSGDNHPNHLDEEYMRSGRFGQRVAHGALIIGLMSAVSTRFLVDRELDGVSYGFDKVRFTAPVYFGDTVTVKYRVDRVDEDSSKSWANVEARNQDEVLVAVATHILKFLR